MLASDFEYALPDDGADEGSEQFPRALEHNWVRVLVIEDNPRLRSIDGVVSGDRTVIRDNPLLESVLLAEPWCGECACGNAGQSACAPTDGGSGDAG